MLRNISLTILLLLLAAAVPAQSGRVKPKPEEEKKKKPEPNVRYLPTQKVEPAGERPSAAPTPTPPARSGEDEISIEATLVPIPVSVIDTRSGRAVTTLELKDFELRIDDAAVEIGEVFRAESPVRLALLFDNSSSVTVARGFEQKAAVRFFRRVIRPDRDLAALYSVAAVARLEQELTRDVGSLVRAIRALPPPEGATSLHDALIEASVYLSDQTGRRVIVVVSDGQDTLSDATFDEMVRLVQQNNCQVYIVHTNEFENKIRTGRRGGSANLRALAAERRMKVLAEQTGGAVYSPVDESELDAAFNQISAELSSQYILGYYPEKEDRDGRFRTIDLTIRSDRDLTVRARKGYYVLRN